MDYFDLQLHGDGGDFNDEFGLGRSDEALLTEQHGVRTPVGTPMESHWSAERQVTMSVSTTFQPTAMLDVTFPDIALVSSDQILFYVHRTRLLAASANKFKDLINPYSPTDGTGGPPTVVLPESADVLNIVLHTIYYLPAAQFLPSFETVSLGLESLLKYGFAPQLYATPSQPLFSLLLSFAPHRPIDTFALAAAYGLEDVAVASSAHLLSFSLSTLTDELAERMGSIYLKRLFFLHLGRMEALKALLLAPPRRHPEARDCDASQQTTLARAWALASAHLVWDARPNLSTHLLRATLLPLERGIECALCRQALHDRVVLLMIKWAAVKPHSNIEISKMIMLFVSSALMGGAIAAAQCLVDRLQGRLIGDSLHFKKGY